MDFDDLRRRAADGELTPDELESVRVHLCPADPSADQTMRRSAIAIAGLYLASHSDIGLMFELFRIAEDADEPDEGVRQAAVRALAGATGYRGQPMRFEP